jgi:hypothetical protein
MRITVYQKTVMYHFLGFLFVCLILSLGFVPLIRAQDEATFLIKVYDSEDWNEQVGTILFERKSYDVIVSATNETDIYGVNITFLGETFQTSSEIPYITFDAPDFDKTDSFVITASKEGYQNATLELTVLRGELFIVSDHDNVEEKTKFQVTVTDQDDAPVEGALVYVTEDASPISTDLNGHALVSAPEIDVINTATIQVVKSGYLPGFTSIRLENAQGSILWLTEPQFLQVLPILLAILVVIFSILYVFFRQRKTQNTPLSHKSMNNSRESKSQIKKEPRENNDYVHSSGIVKKDFSSTGLEPRVEEIRIPVQAKKKETTYLSEEKEQEPAGEGQKNQQDEWFKGQDYMRYKLDELTGKIDQKTDGKWFEGEHGTKYKVDEALKKNLKKKKADETNTK